MPLFFNRIGICSLLLFSGILLWITHCLFTLSAQVQLLLFGAGVVLVGLPHGSADVLVGQQNAAMLQRGFSLSSFVFRYLLKVALFALLFYLLPFAALLFFVVLAAFHFGETDLQQFDTRSTVGKGFALSYGLLILTSILVLHVEEVVPILQALGVKETELRWVESLAAQKLTILSFTLLLFFFSTFVYCWQHRSGHLPNERFLLHLMVLFPLLYALPLLAGFTFYFVVWHSVLSLTDTVCYLRAEGRCSAKAIRQHMLLYSSLSLGGLLLLGGGGWLFFDGQALLVGFLLALALLTAPHMNVMHQMYRHLRHRATGL